MARLRSARLTDGTLVSQIDDFLGELESELATILGVTLDEDVTDTAFDFDNNGKVAKPLVQWKAAGDTNRPVAGAVGLHIENSTNSRDARVALAGIDVTQDGEVLGTIPIFGLGDFDLANYPSGTTYDLDDDFPGFGVRIGGNLLGKTVSSSSQGLVPRGTGNVDEYLCGDGTWRDPNVVSSETAKVYYPVDPVSGLPYGLTPAEVIPNWTLEEIDENSIHAASDDELVIQTDGKYLVGAQVGLTAVGTGGPGVGEVLLSVYRNRGGSTTLWAQFRIPYADIPPNVVCVDTLIDGLTADKFSIGITYSDPTPGETFAIVSDPGYTHFYASRVS